MSVVEEAQHLRALVQSAKDKMAEAQDPASLASVMRDVVDALELLSRQAREESDAWMDGYGTSNDVH